MSLLHRNLLLGVSVPGFFIGTLAPWHQNGQLLLVPGVAVPGCQAPEKLTPARRRPGTGDLRSPVRGISCPGSTGRAPALHSSRTRRNIRTFAAVEAVNQHEPARHLAIVGGLIVDVQRNSMGGAHALARSSRTTGQPAPHRMKVATPRKSGRQTEHSSTAAFLPQEGQEHSRWWRSISREISAGR